MKLKVRTFMRGTLTQTAIPAAYDDPCQLGGQDLLSKPLIENCKEEVVVPSDIQRLRASTPSQNLTTRTVTHRTDFLSPKSLREAKSIYPMRGINRPDFSNTNPLRLVGKRIGANLEFYCFAQCSSAAFCMPSEIRCIGGPHSSTFPSSVWIVDASVQSSCVEIERIWHAHYHPFLCARYKRFQRVRVRAIHDRNVLA